MLRRSCRLRCEAAEEGCKQSHDHLCRSIGAREAGGFGLSVRMRVEDRSIKQAELEHLVRDAHERICPYSHATRDNVEVNFDIVGG
jgi:organic hydroperoxide reductase OsmC/OhrA